MIHRCHSRLQQTKRHYIVRFFFPKTCCDKWAKLLPTTRPTNLIPPHHGSTTGNVVRIHPEGRWQFPKLRLQKINVWTSIKCSTPTQDHRILVAQIWNLIWNPWPEDKEKACKTNKQNHAQWLHAEPMTCAELMTCAVKHAKQMTNKRCPCSWFNEIHCNHVQKPCLRYSYVFKIWGNQQTCGEKACGGQNACWSF